MKFALDAHQDRALDMLRHSLATGHKRPMLQAPTGAGKTVIGASIVEGAVAKGNPVLFAVPFLSLVDQTVERFAEQGIHCVGVMQGQHPATDMDQPVQVASVQAPGRRVEIDCWLEGGAPYLVSVFDPGIQPEPVISEVFDTAGAARVAAGRYARTSGIARVYDLTGGDA